MNELVSKLCRAELITHMIEIDRDAVSEKDAAACVLDVLDAQVFRIAPFLYGVDLSAMQEESDEQRVDLVTEALSARLGPDAVGMTTLVLDPPDPDSASQAEDDDSLLLMRAVAKAADNASAEGDTSMRAMLSAEFAVKAAELTAKGLSELALQSGGQSEELTPAIEATTQALGSLEARLDHLEQRIGEITENSQRDIRDWAEDALLTPLRDVEDRLGAIRSAQTDTLSEWAERIGERLGALEQGQIPAEWFLGQIMSRIGDLDEQLSCQDEASRETAVEWARRLDERISSVADQLVPPEWFLGRIMNRIAELDEQLSGSDQEMRTVAQQWSERFDARLTSVSEQMAPPEWFLGKVLTRIDDLEARALSGANGGSDTSAIETKLSDVHWLCTQNDGRLATIEEALRKPGSGIESEGLSEIRKTQESTKKTIAGLKGQVTGLAKKQEQLAADTSQALDLIRRGLAELLARTQ